MVYNSSVVATATTTVAKEGLFEGRKISMRNRRNNKLFAGIVAGLMAASVIAADADVAMAAPPPPGHHAQRPNPGHQMHRPPHVGHPARPDVRPQRPPQPPRPGHVRPPHVGRPVPPPPPPRPHHDDGDAIAGLVVGGILGAILAKI